MSDKKKVTQQLMTNKTYKKYFLKIWGITIMTFRDVNQHMRAWNNQSSLSTSVGIQVYHDKDHILNSNQAHPKSHLKANSLTTSKSKSLLRKIPFQHIY